MVFFNCHLDCFECKEKIQNFQVVMGPRSHGFTNRFFVGRWKLGGNSNIFIFAPNFGEDSHFDSYFSKGLKPPTSHPQNKDAFCFFLFFWSDEHPLKLVTFFVISWYRKKDHFSCTFTKTMGHTHTNERQRLVVFVCYFDESFRRKHHCRGRIWSHSSSGR